MKMTEGVRVFSCLKDAYWRNNLSDVFDYIVFSLLRTKIILWLNRVVIKGQGRVRVARKTALRISKKADLLIHNGEFAIGFHFFGYRSMPTFNHTTFVAHPKSCIVIEGSVQICPGSLVVVGPSAIFRVGADVNICPNSIVVCNHEIIIGEGSLFSSGLTIIDDDAHLIHYESEGKNIKLKNPKIQIGKRVWTGHHVTILKGVTIGDGVIIGANSVVTKDIPSHCMAAGNPAKVIKEGVQWSL